MSSAARSTVPETGAAPATATVSVLGLREGATGAGVRAVQERLISFGYVIRSGADGVFGPSTTRVLISAGAGALCHAAIAAANDAHAERGETAHEAPAPRQRG